MHGGPPGGRGGRVHLPHRAVPPLQRQVHVQQRGELLHPHRELRGRGLRLRGLHVRVLRVERAEPRAAARHLGVLGAPARLRRGAAARLHLARVLPAPPRALALPARVRAVGGVDRVLRAGRGGRPRAAPRARRPLAARERRRDAAGQDRFHHGDHQQARVRAEDAEPLGRGPHLRHVVRGHPALPVQDPLQPVGRAAHVRRQHRAQAHPRHALLVMHTVSALRHCQPTDTEHGFYNFLRRGN